MDEEITNWIRKKKKEIEDLRDDFEKLPNAKTQPTEDQTAKPIELEQNQAIEQKTAPETTQSVFLPKGSEATVPLEYKPEETPKEEQEPYTPSHSNAMKTQYPSKLPLLTRKSKILLVLIAISIPMVIFIFLYVIPKIFI